MINVSAITSGLRVPSSRFRVRQFIEPLSAFGIRVSEHPLPIEKYTPKLPAPFQYFMEASKALVRIPALLAAKRSDLTWLERELIPRRCTLERFAGTKRVFDVDDAIWLTDESNFSEEIAAECNGVIAGNQFIADHYRKEGYKVWIVPTSINTEVWRPGPKRASINWTIGWTGSSSNLPYLYDIEEPMADFLTRHTDTRLLVVCDKKPLFKKIPAACWHFEKWSAETEVPLVQQMNVGLMPLRNTEWARMKCALKMILYMAVGIPTVVSPVGVNAEILGQSEVGLPATSGDGWYEGLRLLYYDRALASRFGAAGRKLAEERYSTAKNVSLLAHIFREVLAL